MLSNDLELTKAKKVGLVMQLEELQQHLD